MPSPAGGIATPRKRSAPWQLHLTRARARPAPGLHAGQDLRAASASWNVANLRAHHATWRDGKEKLVLAEVSNTQRSCAAHLPTRCHAACGSMPARALLFFTHHLDDRSPMRAAIALMASPQCLCLAARGDRHGIVGVSFAGPHRRRMSGPSCSGRAESLGKKPNRIEHFRRCAAVLPRGLGGVPTGRFGSAWDRHGIGLAWYDPHAVL